MSQKEKNIETQKKFGEAINSGKLDQIRQLVAENCLDHDPAPNQAQGPEGFIDFFRHFREAFPDLKVEPEHMVADENNVTLAYTVTGTHKGSFQGIPATGKHIKARGVQIGRFENGKLVERWGSSDELGILKEIGVWQAA